MLFEKPNKFSVVERILNNQSAEYILQFWESGLNSIPPFRVIVKKNKIKISQLQSDIIKIAVLSNINENDLQNALH